MMKLSSPFIIILLLLAADLTTASGQTSITYKYDANGNLISGNGQHCEYNEANQLVKVRQGGKNGPVIAQYFYDYTGQRIKKTENGITTYYIGKHYEQKVSNTGRTITKYYSANGERVAKKDSTGNVVYYHSDHLGGTNALTGPNRDLIEKTIYYPFGEIREGGNEQYTYTGKEKDKLTDLYYFEARYYDPIFEHFTQVDTISSNLYEPQSLNRYAYVKNNPLKYIDPNGHSEYLTIYSVSGEHSWLEHEDNDSNITTYGTWSEGSGISKSKGGIRINEEKYLKNYNKFKEIAAKNRIEINNNQVDKFKMYINAYEKLGDKAWTKNMPCSSFATQVWNAITGDNLNALNIGGVSTPGHLAKSINRSGDNNYDNNLWTLGDYKEGFWTLGVMYPEFYPYLAKTYWLGNKLSSH